MKAAVIIAGVVVLLLTIGVYEIVNRKRKIDAGICPECVNGWISSEVGGACIACDGTGEYRGSIEDAHARQERAAADWRRRKRALYEALMQERGI